MPSCRCYSGKEEVPNPKDNQKSPLCAAGWGVGVLNAGVSLPSLSYIPSSVLAARPRA